MSYITECFKAALTDKIGQQDENDLCLWLIWVKVIASYMMRCPRNEYDGD